MSPILLIDFLSQKSQTIRASNPLDVIWISCFSLSTLTINEDYLSFGPTVSWISLWWICPFRLWKIVKPILIFYLLFFYFIFSIYLFCRKKLKHIQLHKKCECTKQSMQASCSNGYEPLCDLLCVRCHFFPNFKEVAVIAGQLNGVGIQTKTAFNQDR